MPQRTSYDTAVKHLFRLRCEDILPHDLRRAIPASNRHRWRNEPPDKYAGAQLNDLARRELQTLTAFAQHRQAQRVFRAYCRLILVVQQIVLKLPPLRSALRDHAATILDTFERCSPTIPLKHLLKLLGISRSTFHQWKSQRLHLCAGSPLDLCFRRHPLQTTRAELRRLRNLLTDSRFLHWPIRSIAAFARREGLLFLCDNSWYRYARLLNLTRRPPKKLRPRQSVRASAPDRIWHADVTLLKTRDGLRHYIYLVMDNCSRKILAWRVATHLSATLRVATLRDAWENRAVRSPETTDLIVDGGSENHAHVVEAFINGEGISMHKLIALRDVHFSNSLIEAGNKTLKYGYLLPNLPRDGTALEESLKEAIHDYNTVRPHGSIGGLTPSEAYAGMQPRNYHAEVARARQDRIQANVGMQCGRYEE